MSFVHLVCLEEWNGCDAEPSGLVQGTLHMLILKTLTLEPLHGYGIGVRLEQISRRRIPGQRRVIVPGVAATGA